MKYYEYQRNQSTLLYYCISIYYINKSEFTNFLQNSIFIPGSGYQTKCKCLFFRHLHFSFCTTVAPHLHHIIESFKPKSRHFHILSIKQPFLWRESAKFSCCPRKGPYIRPFLWTANVFALSRRGFGEGYKLSPARNHAEISARKSFRTYRFP